jgi:REP element-mobilizing transposase RayT
MDYDYSLEGAYFVTIVTYQRACLFGNIGNGKTELNPSSEIAFEQWVQLGHRFPQSDFSSFVIMPNHVHGIVVMVKGSGEKTKFNQDQMSTKQPNNNSKATPCLLGTVVRAYKASVTYRINAMRGSTKPPVWQRNYFEKIIRNQWENENIWKYIIANPDRWEEDQLHT